MDNDTNDLTKTNMEKLEHYVRLYESLTFDESYEYERKKIMELIVDNLTKNKNTIWASIVDNFNNIIKLNNINKYSSFTYNHEIFCSDELKNIKMNSLRNNYIISDKRLKGLLNNNTSLDDLYKLFGTNRFNIIVTFMEYAPEPSIERFEIKIVIVFNAIGFVDFINSCDKNNDGENKYYDNDDTINILENIRKTTTIAKKPSTIVKEHIRLPDDTNFPIIGKISDMIIKLNINDKIKEISIVKYLIHEHHVNFIKRIKNKKGYYEDEEVYYDSNINIPDENKNIDDVIAQKIYNAPTLHTINISSLFDPDNFIEKHDSHIRKFNRFDSSQYYAFTNVENEYLNTLLNFGPNNILCYIIVFSEKKMTLYCKIMLPYSDVDEEKSNDPKNQIFMNILFDNNHKRRFDNIIRSYAKELAIGIPKTIDNIFPAFRSLQIARKKCIENNEPLENYNYMSFYFDQKFSDYISTKRRVYKYENEDVIETAMEELITDDFITPEMNYKINNILNVKDFIFKYGCNDYISYEDGLFSSLTLEFIPPDYLLVNK